MAAVNKNKFLDLKKIIKEEPGTNVRLQSLKLPRELNLGIPKQPKKVFVPNLNATRNKERSKEFNKKDERGKDRARERKQKLRDNAPKFVQSSGVFSEGMGNDIIRTSRWNGSRVDKENDNAPTISMPTIKKNAFQIDKKTEDKVLNKITGCDEDSDDEKLPFKPISWQNKLQKTSLIKKEISNPIKPKEEDLNEDDVTPSLKKLKLDAGYSENVHLIHKDFIKDEHLNNDNPSISLWGVSTGCFSLKIEAPSIYGVFQELPDSFAGKGLSDDPNCKKLFDYNLGDMHEGQVGKILIRKSGKIEVQIGTMKYELEPGESDSYKEDIISLDLENCKNKTNAATLGNIKNRYFLTPDWDRLLL